MMLKFLTKIINHRLFSSSSKHLIKCPEAFLDFNKKFFTFPKTINIVTNICRYKPACLIAANYCFAGPSSGELYYCHYGFEKNPLKIIII